MENLKVDWIPPYLKSLSSNEPFVSHSPTEGKINRPKDICGFTERLTASKDIERSLDSHFASNKSPVQNFLPPVQVKFSENCGRFLEASRDIQEGETIFWEPPLVLAPKSGAGPTCLDCFLSLSESKWSCCENCSCPKCSDCCEGNEHSDMECSFLKELFRGSDIGSNINLVKRLNVVLTPLRTHIAILESPSIKSIVNSLQSNINERSNSPIEKFIDKYIVEFFKNKTYPNLDSNFIHCVCGVFDTNAFDVTLGDRKQARALLPLASLMNHSCKPNTQHWFLGGHCVVRASVQIQKGNPVTNSYTQTLWGTKTRQNHLKLTKYFKCTCPRCEDPTEFESHLSSVLCLNCGTALIIPSSCESESTQCPSCGRTIPSSTFDNLIKIGSSITSGIEGKDLEFIKKTSKKIMAMLGTQHYISVKLKFVFVQKIIGSLQSASTDDINEALSINQSLLHLMDILEPGVTRVKGKLYLSKLQLTTELLWRNLNSSTNSELKIQRFRSSDPTFVEDLDTSAELCEELLKWDSLLEEVQMARDSWKVIKAQMQHLKD